MCHILEISYMSSIDKPIWVMVYLDNSWVNLMRNKYDQFFALWLLRRGVSMVCIS